MNQPTPRQDAPDLSFNLVGGETWTLKDRSPRTFTMVIFYRGLHCPVCKGYSRKAQSLLGEYEERGVEVVAVSMDDEKRAKKTVDEWELSDLNVGYGLSASQAQDWGLYFSGGVKDPEPELFSEPGLFLVRPNGELYYAAVNSMPFGRPDLSEMLKAIDFVREKDYPARGEATPGAVAAD